ncbi:chromosomal replication initiator protein DnaA [Mycoplasma simbae]|uniref:chromosomal replication initiator protein DnaA n=1 Tax=Mycoplasma simbae TaxID=36744 RepID=UPI00068F5DC1|nr:chromosomal replication initiator protein DnaA [Mycoplasma simbae]
MRKDEIEKSRNIAINEAFLKSMAIEVSDKMLFKSFFLPLRIVDVTAGFVTIETDLSKDSINIIKSSFNDKVIKVLSEILNLNASYSIEHKKAIKKIVSPDPIVTQKVQEVKKQIIKTLRKNNDTFVREFTFETYVEGDFNREAIKIGREIAAGNFNFNPVFISANSGLGKTHLLNAIGNELNKQDKKVIYLNPADFVSDISMLLQENNQAKIKATTDDLNNADVVMFDDFQYYGQGNKKSTLQIINQILDHRINTNKLTIFCSDKSIISLNSTFDQRLITRLTMGLQVQIKNPRQADLLKILEYFIEIKNMHPDNWEKEAKEFIARNFHDSIRSLQGAINRLFFYNDGIAKNANGRYTEAIVNKILSSIASNKERITPESIVEYVAKYYRVSKKDILGKSRLKDIVLARHIAMFIIREEMGISLEKIGQIFGNRDHSTIINAIKKVEASRELTDQTYNRAISAISEEIYKLK